MTFGEGDVLRDAVLELVFGDGKRLDAFLE